MSTSQFQRTFQWGCDLPTEKLSKSTWNYNSPLSPHTALLFSAIAILIHKFDLLELWNVTLIFCTFYTAHLVITIPNNISPATE